MDAIGLAGEALTAKMDGNNLPNVALVQDHSRPADHTIDATLPWWLAGSARP